MPAPVTNLDPPFNVTRASHISLTVQDLGRSRDFYTEVIGLVISHQTDSAVYLRGLEESCHHSLILRQDAAKPVCDLVGFRVFRDEDLDHAKEYFDRTGIEAWWAEPDFQGRSLRCRDSIGIPLEFCATMPVLSRIHDKPDLHRGAGALRFDHTQCLARDVPKAGAFYADIGFRISDYFVDKETDDTPLGLFFYRKNNPHDIVFLTRPGPFLHHFAYIVPESQNLFRALDTAGSIGFAGCFERGPGRHGQGHALYVYFRDPDGHRVEILPPPIQIMDLDDKPMKWHSGNRFTWDLPPSRKWLFEATPFEGSSILQPKDEQVLYSLEDHLAAQVR